MTDTLDGSGLGVSIFAKLSATLDGLTASIDANRRTTERAIAQAAELMPTYGKHTGTVLYPAAGVGVIVLGSPTQGRVRLIRKIVIGGITPTTAAAGRADVFVAQLPPGLVASGGLASMSLGEWEDQATALPAVGPWSNEQLVQKPLEQLLIVISNGTPGQQYQASCRFEEYMDSPATRTTFEL